VRRGQVRLWVRVKPYQTSAAERKSRTTVERDGQGLHKGEPGERKKIGGKAKRELFTWTREGVRGEGSRNVVVLSILQDQGVKGKDSREG